MHPEHPEVEFGIEARAVTAVSDAKVDLYHFLSHFSFQGVPHALFYSNLLETFKFKTKTQTIQQVIEESQPFAYPESKVLTQRLNYVLSRRISIFQKAYDIALQEPRIRRKQWNTITPQVIELQPELHQLPLDASECHRFVIRLHAPEDRYQALQHLAHHMLHATQSIPLSEEPLRRQRTILQHLEKGLIGPNQITLFDVLRATERIRNGFME